MTQLSERLAQLSPAQRRLLESRLGAAAAASGAAPAGSNSDAIPRRAAGQPTPASSAQRQLWFLDQLRPGSLAYNNAHAIDLRGPLDESVLRDCLNQIVRRHESLRMQFAPVDGEPFLHILPPAALDLPLVDLTDLPEPDRLQQARQRAAALARQPFDLAHGPLFRTQLLRLEHEHHLLVCVVHHIVSDRWSLGVLVRELAQLYEAAATGRPAPVGELPLGYGDYAIWQRGAVAAGLSDEQCAYWQEALGQRPPIFELPTDRPRPPVQTERGAWHTAQLPAHLVQRLGELARQRGATSFMLLLAAFQALLHRYTQQEQVIVGTPLAGRSRVELENLIGLFVNVLPLCVDVLGEMPFEQLLARTKAAALGVLAHQDVPLDKLVEALRIPRDSARSPLFQIVFNYHNVPPPPPGLSGLAIEVADVECGTARFDLMLTLRPLASGDLFACFEYNRDLFDAQTIARLAGHYRVLLDGIAANPAMPVHDLPLLTQGERRQLLVEWSSDASHRPPDRCAHEFFEQQARRTPDAVALVEGHQRLTYAQLNQQSNQLAHHLRALGVGPETLVAVCLCRSQRLVVALLAVLKSGAAYVPLDPAYPAQRLSYMLEDSRAPFLLTEQQVLASLPLAAPTIIDLDRDAPAMAQRPGHDLPPLAGLHHLAYVIYTSGSTGKPKGVAVEHRGPASLVAWANRAIPDDQAAGMLFSTSACFDLSVFELLVPLSRGGRMILVENALYLPKCPARDEVTFINTVPSVMAELLRLGELPASVRAIGLAGEPLPLALAKQCYACAGVRDVYNLYGPTEDTVYSTAHRVDPASDQPPAIGRPIGGTLAYLLDDRHQLVPVGMSGELYLGGVKLARGYLHRPELSAERFIPDPFGQPGQRLYLTGDLCRYAPDGTIQFICRRDHQVKLRGFRIELGEIETLLGRHPAVGQCVATVLGQQSEQRLVAFLTAANSHPPTPRDLRTHLAGHLPDYMIPSSFIVLDALPQTPNGKIDRKALPALAAGSPSAPAPDAKAAADAAPLPPQTPTQCQLAEIWTELLHLTHVAPPDNFFELGGHSLRAVALAARIQQRFAVELPLRSVFEHSTLAALAEEVDRRLAQAPAPAAPSPLDLEPASTDAPLSPAQLRLWFLDRYESDPATYNVPVARRLIGPLDVARLERALAEVVHRHEILRTCFPDKEGIPSQYVLPAIPVSLPVIGCVAPGAEQDAEIARLIAAEIKAPFDLKCGPLWRARLIRLRPEEHILVLTIHHIACDDWSLRLLLGELSRIYAGGEQLRRLPPLTSQYRHFAAAQQRWLASEQCLQQLAYWKQHLHNAPPLLQLPLDHPRPARQTFRGRRQTLVLPAPLADAVAALARQQGMTSFMLLLALFQALLWRWTGQNDLVVSTPIANRDRPETQPLIGFFLNTLPIRVSLDGAPTFRQLLARTKHAALGAYSHSQLPFEKLIEELRPPRHLGASPLFQVMFVLLNDGTATLDLPGVRCDYLAADTGTSKFDLTMLLTEQPDGPITGVLEYNLDLFDPATIRDLAEQFVDLAATVLADPDRPLSHLRPEAIDRPSSREAIRPSAIPVPDPVRRHLPPHNDVEQALVDIWRDVLNVTEIGVEDDFFELGGQSLLAARVFAKIEKRLGRALPLSLLFTAPTIAQLAAQITAADPAPTPSDGLIPLQPSGSASPLFCIAGTGGHVFGFRPLAQRFAPDRPVYGLELDGVDLKRSALDRVEAAAALLVQRIRALQPHGPYHLIGYSFGGLLAYEIAQQLSAAGQSVGLLAVIDSFAPGSFRKRPLPQRLALHARQLIGSGLKDIPAYSWNRATSLLARVAARFHASGHAPSEALPAPAAAPAGDDTRVGQAIQRVHQASLQAYRAYRPRPYIGDMVLFRASQRPAWYGFVNVSPLNGWEDLVQGQIDARLVPGAHQTLLDDPLSVHSLAGQLTQCLSPKASPHPDRLEAS